MGKKSAPFHPSEVQYPPSVHEYELPGGWYVWAGKTAADNDKLSLRVARNDDWWFHLRGSPGSHVVLFVRDGTEPDRQTLEAAAAIAAFHSKQRGGGTVGVTATRARFVKKPRGAKAGLVSIRKETVFKVKPAIP
jgi:predicted ribosome quality control (RQC) complex YloA/Tae2 family protein